MIPFLYSKYLKNKASWLLSIFFLMVGNGVFAQDAISDFVAANQAYNEQQYDQAIQMYQSLIDRGLHNGHLYYNLGNAYFRSGELGEAIGNYLHALKYLPRHEDIHANLNYLRQQTIDKKEETDNGWQSVLLDWTAQLTLTGWIYGLIAFNVLFWGFALLRLFYNREIVTWMIFFSGGIVSIFFIATIIKWALPQPIGVILPTEVNVVSSPHEQATVLFKLHEGTESIVTNQVDNWVEIQFDASKKGWLPSDSLIIIDPLD